MKKKIFGIVAIMLVAVMTLSSCSFIYDIQDFFNGIFNPSVELTDEALDADMLIDFAEGAKPDVLFESDGWTNGDVFNVVWKKSNVIYENGIMRLGITEEKASAWLGDAEVEFDYTAGEARTQNYYHYGDYEVSMKPSANPGTASTFFVCTGPYDLKNGESNPHDEIDIEFLGNDTTHVQFNFFVNGKGGNEYMYDLGFDASEEFHTYGFRWLPDSITWFVDGKPVYKVTTDATATPAGNLRVVEVLPSTAGRILTNYWCGNERAWGWMGAYVGSTKDQGTEYQWIKTSAEGAPLNPPVDNPPVEGGDEIDWSAIEPIAPTFATTPEYTVAIDGNKANITYTDISGSAYKPVEMDVTDAVAGKNYVYLKVTNNGSETVNVRVNMYDPTLTGNNTATNISATMNGEAVRTDLDWGGSFFDIPAGETAELVVYFGVGGVKLQLMIDSSRNDSTLRSGDVTVEEIKFTAVGDVEVPHKCADADEDGKCDGCGEDMPLPPEPVPEDPVSGNLTLNFGDFTTNIGGNVTDGYGVNVDENNNIYVEYTNIVGNSYKNIWADVSAIAGTKTTFTVKVTNNGEASVKIRIDIESQTNTSANTTCCNVSATQDGVGVFTDTEWGGSVFEIAAGATATLEVVYNPVHKPTNVKIMIDSCQWDDSTSHAGEVIFSDIAFSGDYQSEPEKVDPIVNISDLAKGTTDGSELIPGTGIFAAAGLAIDGNSKSIDGFEFTLRLKLGGTLKPDSKHIIVNTDNAATIILYAIASSNDAVGRKLQIGTVTDGVFTSFAQTEDVSGAEIAKYEFKVDAAGTYYIGSTDSGINLYYIAVSYEEEKPEPDPEPNPDPVPEYTDLYVEFKTENAYTLVAPDTYANSVRVTYSDIAQNSWSNINVWAEDKSEGCNIFSFKVTNHGTAPVSVWVQLKDASGAELVNENKNIAAGAEEVVTFNYDGRVQMIFFFVDSTHEAAAATNAGDITLSELKLGKLSAEEPTPPPAGGDDVPPAEPVEGEYLSFTGNDCYTLSATPADYVNSIHVTYTAVSDNSYQNVNAWIQDKAAGKFAAGVTIKNNGTETVNITVKLENGAAEAAETKVVLAAGETQTVSLPYSFTPDLIYFFIDSGWSETTATHAGDITISGINFQ